MIDRIRPPSLLPYLQSGTGRFHLMINLEPADEASPFEPCQEPFQFEDISDPFSLLGKAGVAGDLAAQMLPLHMLIQRSDYHSSPEYPDIYTNLSIEQRWQRILSLLAVPQLNTLPFLLAEQIGKKGQLLPFSPLFYCRAKQIFFPPPCPGCGKELELCTDDALLSLHGLGKYSTSLRRFLYCPDCSSDGVNGDYYVFRRAEKDPDCVSDIQQLIRNWALLQKTAAPDTLFPCGSCPTYKVCYGSTTLAVNTLCSFSFYPFYMLLLKADSGIHLDFQALLSGRTQPRDCLYCEENPTETASRPQPTTLETSGPTPETDSPDASANAAIHAILMDISAQWERSEEKEKQPQHDSKISKSSSIPFSHETEPADWMETVILSSTPISQDITHSMKSEERGAIPQEEDFSPDTTGMISPQFNPAATVLLQQMVSEDQSPRKASFDRPVKNRPEEYLQETIIISPQMGQQPNHLKPPPLPENTGSETINGGQAPFPDGKTSDRDLAETIIQRPVKKP